MAWVRVVTGRLKSDFQYSVKLVYNNYPWPQQPSDKQRAAVEAAAEAVLAARAKFATSTLADLYDPLAMPPALVKAHDALDRAVDRCYQDKPFANDRARVEHLFVLYEQISAPLAMQAAKTKRKPKPPAAHLPADGTNDDARAAAAHFHSSLTLNEDPPGWGSAIR